MDGEELSKLTEFYSTLHRSIHLLKDRIHCDNCGACMRIIIRYNKIDGQELRCDTYFSAVSIRKHNISEVIIFFRINACNIPIGDIFKIVNSTIYN